MTYSETFFVILVIGSLIALVGVYAFQLAVFIIDHRAGRLQSKPEDGGESA